MGYLQFGRIDHYVITRGEDKLDSWTRRGYVRLPEQGTMAIARMAADEANRADLKRFWQEALREPFPEFGSPSELRRRLAERVQPRNGFFFLGRTLRGPLTAVDLPKQESKGEDLAAARYALNLVLVDEWGNPAGQLEYDLTPPNGSPTPGTFPASGETRHDGLEAGTGTLNLKQVHPDDWQERKAPPLGWFQSGLALRVVDAHGVPYAKVSFEAKFDNGVGLRAELDDNGSARIEETPSYPVTVKLRGFDPEKFR